MDNDYNGFSEQPENEKKKRPPREFNEYSDTFWSNVEDIVLHSMDPRRRRSWTDLARVLNTDRTTIASMRSRRSRLTLDTVIKVSEALHVPVEKLIYRDTDIQQEINTMYLSETEMNIIDQFKMLQNKNRQETAYRIIMDVLSELRNMP